MVQMARKKIKSTITKTYTETTSNGITRYAETTTTSRSTGDTLMTTTAVLHDTTTDLYSRTFCGTYPWGNTPETTASISTEMGQSMIRVFRGEHRKDLVTS